jgi:multiple sugar transport system permease protein
MKQGRRVLRSSTKEAISGYLFALPYLLFFFVFVVYPVFQGFWLSLHDFNVIDNSSTWLGLTNYQTALRDETFWKALRNTAYFTVLSAPLLVLTGLMLAMGVNREFKLRGLFRLIFFSPHVLSISVVGSLWVWMLQQKYGIIARALVALGWHNPPNFLFTPTWAMPAVVITTVWWTVGFNMTMFLAGLQDISLTLYEAAAIDGANAWQQFRNITLPGLRRVMLFVGIQQVIASFQIFGQVFIMTQGGPYGSTRVVIQYIYENAFKYFKTGYASAMAYLVFLVILILSVIQLRLQPDQGAD